jgi:hypothetical protein
MGRHTDQNRFAAAARAAASGVVLGVATLVLIDGLRAAGQGALATLAAEVIFILALAVMAATTTFARPAQMRRVRVHLRRGVSPSQEHEDHTAVLAFLMGGPVVLASMVSATLIR